MGTVRSPSERTLHLLSLLQNGGHWPAPVLARRLEVSERTVRRDAQRLRDLGYDVRARPGPGAGYRLHPSIRIPPLLFTADEVGALVAGLCVLNAWISDDDSAAAALTKLERVLPRELRGRAAATAMTTQVLQRPVAIIDWGVVGVLADAVATCTLVRFHYTDRHATQSVRTVEPFRHVLHRGRWYLIAFDADRDDWRLFCLDRIAELRELPATFGARVFPAKSVEHWLTTDFARTEGNGKIG